MKELVAMMSKVLAVTIILIVSLLSGCVYENFSPMEGWNQARYNEYSQLYYSIYEDEISPVNTSTEMRQRIGKAQDKTFQIQSFYVNTVQKDTEFERAWFSAFSNYVLGLNAEIVSYEKQKYLGEGRRVKVMDSTRNPDVPPEEIFIKGGFEDTQEAKEWREKAQFHFNKSLEYRKLIEDANPFHQANTLVIKTPNIIESSSITTSQITPTTTPTPAITSVMEQKIFTNSIDMEFVLIPAGEFDMGSPSNEKGRHNNEGPVHHVKLTKDFYIGKYETTQKHWREIMGNNPLKFEGDNFPVVGVSWDEAQDFVKKLNEKEGTNKYRLLSEAEWEYTARAGTSTTYSFGDDTSKIGDYAWYNANSGNGPHTVGQKKPNLWGLYDMHGNVWEWVQDSWHDSYNGAPTDGSAWEGDSYSRIARGGSWGDPAGDCRSSERNYPGGKINRIGFRLVRDL